jgi:hypothetical protein
MTTCLPPNPLAISIPPVLPERHGCEEPINLGLTEAPRDWLVVIAPARGSVALWLEKIHIAGGAVGWMAR